MYPFEWALSFTLNTTYWKTSKHFCTTCGRLLASLRIAVLTSSSIMRASVKYLVIRSYSKKMSSLW
jgi:hypothetical protein